MRIGVFCSAVVCLVLFSRTDACNLEIITTRSPTNISSPGYPFKNYPKNTNCWWRIDASDEDSNVIVRVLDSTIEQSQNCTYDSLSIYDGPDATGPSLGRLCGRSRTSVISSGRSIYIVFKSDSSNQYKGFLLQFSETTRCGGELTATPEGTTFSSPGFPYWYANDMNCTWYFTAENENDTIVMTFDVIDVETSIHCDTASVSIYNDHDNNDEQLLAQVCDSTTPHLQSSRNKMRIDFTRAMDSSGTGFSLTFKTVKADVCKLTILSSTTPQYFVSPGYPDGYDSDLDCTWVIVALDQLYVQLDVIDSEIEGPDPSCSNDSVTVYGSMNFSSTALGTFCGNATPTYTSPNHGLFVKFKTDDVIEDKGFRIRYTSVRKIDQCGNTSLTAQTTSKYLQSPGYPNNYQNDDLCIWTITASSQSSMVRIVVLDSVLEGGYDCPYDSVTVYDGSSIHSSVIAVWCNTMTPTVQSTGYAMTLRFKTDDTNTFRGFRLKYFETTSPLPCGGHENALSYDQYITSPGYPGNYPPNKDCIWSVTSDFTQIKINVLDNQMEGLSCTNDNVTIIDGDGVSLIGELCGSNTPTIYSSGSSVTIRFHSDSTVSGRGFKLTYTGGDDFNPCGEQDISAEPWLDYITSPNYPYHYPRDTDCSWSINTGDVDMVVSVDVITSNLESSSSCSYDYIEFFDGYSDLDTSLGRYCGSDLPSKHSSGENMYIKFHSDNSNTDTGFKLSYEAKVRDSFSDPVNIGGIVGGTVGGFCFICIFIGILVTARKRNRPAVTQIRDNIVHNVSHGPYETTVTPAAFQPPPAYAQVVNSPPYPQPVATRDTAPIVTQVAD
ncbi:cubilin-like [Haliotis asinina]|uniref:cubilin-like n=1 Tax=Haliotis asinina TaxID=109174 RepID=UPI0035321F87